jgi:hypothetical protein
MYVFCLSFVLPFLLAAMRQPAPCVVHSACSLSRFSGPLLQDVITDAYALPVPLSAPGLGLPAGSYAHAGVVAAAARLCADLDRTRVLERFFEARPDYALV